MTDTTKRIRELLADYEEAVRTGEYIPHREGVLSHAVIDELPALLDNLDRAAGIIELQQKSRPLPMADCAGCESLKAEVARLRNCVPDTWLDSLLSGPDAVETIGSCGCPNTEKLLQAIRKRMAAPEGD